MLMTSTLGNPDKDQRCPKRNHIYGNPDTGHGHLMAREKWHLWQPLSGDRRNNLLQYELRTLSPFASWPCQKAFRTSFFAFCWCWYPGQLGEEKEKHFFLYLFSKPRIDLVSPDSLFTSPSWSSQGLSPKEKGTRKRKSKDKPSYVFRVEYKAMTQTQISP